MTVSKKRQPTITLTKDQKTAYKDIGANKSGQIRYLSSLGYKNAQIARHVGIIDQFVSNVLKNERIKKAPKII